MSFLALHILFFSNIKSASENKKESSSVTMEENYSNGLAEIISYFFERHSPNEWMFLFIFFVLCRLTFGKAETVGNMFLLVCSEEEHSNIMEKIFGDILALCLGSILLIWPIIVTLFLLKFIFLSFGYSVLVINTNIFLMDCVFIWAVISCGYVRNKEKKEYIAHIDYLKKESADLRCSIILQAQKLQQQSDSDQS